MQEGANCRSASGPIHVRFKWPTEHAFQLLTTKNRGTVNSCFPPDILMHQFLFLTCHDGFCSLIVGAPGWKAHISIRNDLSEKKSKNATSGDQKKHGERTQCLHLQQGVWYAQLQHQLHPREKQLQLGASVVSSWVGLSQMPWLLPLPSLWLSSSAPAQLHWCLGLR